MLPDRKAHEPGGQFLAAEVEADLASFRKTAGAVELPSLRRGIHEDVGEEKAGDHGLEMLQQSTADAASAMAGRGAQEPDLVHVQAGNPQYPAFRFVNSNVEEFCALFHTAGRFCPLEFFAHCRRE
jgi:hypothetical protein